MALDQPQVNRLWEAVRRTSREVVWELSPDGILTFMNDAAAEMFGVPTEELIGRNGFSLIHPEDVDRALGIFTACLTDKTGWDKIRVRIVRSDGAVLWVETSGVAHIRDEGQLLGFTATTRRLDADDVREVELGRIEERIREVLIGRHLRTVWQPIHSVPSGGIVGAEALTRFSHLMKQTPDRWFADAAEVGLGVDLEMLAVEAALNSARAIPESVYLSLNASPSLVSSGELIGVLEGSPIRPERVVIELTEHVSVEDYGGLVQPLDNLRSRGVRLAVDDAGAGFASFRHILRLNPNIIKLDQSITIGITGNPAQRALATALVLFALEAGPMDVAAEGVETADDLATVTSLGLDAAQGYYLSLPRPVEEVDWQAVIPAT